MSSGPEDKLNGTAEKTTSVKLTLHFKVKSKRNPSYKNARNTKFGVLHLKGLRSEGLVKSNQHIGLVVWIICWLIYLKTNILQNITPKMIGRY